MAKTGLYYVYKETDHTTQIDGDKGDIVVSDNGDTWLIDTPTVVTVAADDKVIIKDTSASDATKYVTTQSIADLYTIPNGDKGDITTSSSGTVWTIDTPVSVTPQTDDKILIKDTSDSDNLKRVSVQSIIDLVPALTDGDKGDITVSSSGAVFTIDTPTSTSAATDDKVLIKDTSAGDATRYTTVSSIHDSIITLMDGDKGDITIGSGGTTYTIDNDVVTYAKMQNVSATDKLLGRSTAGSGDVEEIACTAAGRALIDDADASTQRTTLGLAIGIDVQAYDAELAALAGLTSAANKVPYFTGSGTAGLADLSANMRTFMTTPSSENLRTLLSDESGTGSAVFASSPTLVTPTIEGTGPNIRYYETDAAADNGRWIAGGGSERFFIATAADASPGTVAALAIDINRTGTTIDSTSISKLSATNATLVTPVLGTPTSGTLTNCTGLPISTGVSGLGTNVGTFLATPSSANLAAALTDETGSGANVFATSPTLVTPTLGVASATSINFGQDALGYYDEGTWTPALAFATPGDFALNATIQVGVYTRIGNTVFAAYNVSAAPTWTTASGSLSITGLPFTIVNTTNYRAGSSGSWTLNGFGFSAGYTWLTVAGLPNVTSILVIQNGPNKAAAVTAAALYTSGSTLNFSGLLTFQV